jgi:hypothetical protein
VNGKMIDHLGKQGTSGVHRQSLPPRRARLWSNRSSNRLRRPRLFQHGETRPFSICSGN